MKLCRICGEEPPVKEGLCELCLCYRFGVSAMEFNEKKASKAEWIATVSALALAILIAVAYSVWERFS